MPGVHNPLTIPAAVEWEGTCSRGGGGGRPGEEVNRAPEPARDGGRRGPEDPEPLIRDRDTLVEGVGGRMEDEDEAAEQEAGGLTEVLPLESKVSFP